MKTSHMLLATFALAAFSIGCGDAAAPKTNGTTAPKADLGKPAAKPADTAKPAAEEKKPEAAKPAVPAKDAAPKTDAKK